MTLLEIKTAVASYFNKTVADLTINGQDMFLLAANNVRRQAELNYDFEFSRRLVTMSVNGVTGGSLSSAVIYGTATGVTIKSVIEVGLFDDEANLRPVEWTTVAESLERQRLDNPRTVPRYPTDAWFDTDPIGQCRFDFSGDNVYRFPKDDTATFTLGLEVYALTEDWTAVNATVTVSGSDLIPNVEGQYYESSTPSVNGSPVYVRDDGLALIMCDGTWFNIFSISNGNTDYFRRSVAFGLTGSYGGGLVGGASGSPFASLNAAQPDIWTTYGAQFLIWATICELNHRFKEFVFRQEGNLAPPEKLRDEALASLVNWDTAKFEQNRRHGR